MWFLIRRPSHFDMFVDKLSLNLYNCKSNIVHALTISEKISQRENGTVFTSANIQQLKMSTSTILLIY